jgi:ABC-type branched-subunit amino acid transport system substrate-binding protein
LQKTYRPQLTLLLTAVVVVLSVCPVLLKSQTVTTSGQRELSAAEARGKQIYLKGTSTNGREILAYIGDPPTEIPGGAMACVNCHGRDGKGKAEGGIVPSNITWPALTKPYEIRQPSGRKHPPYTDKAVELALTRGYDPAGAKLLNIMPRYAMAREDLSDLLAYLKRLGEERERGVSETEITIGVVIPGDPKLAGIGEAIKSVNTAFFEDLNAQGGIYNRKVTVKFIETGRSPADTVKNLNRSIEEQQIFALVNSFIAGADDGVAELMKQLQVPLIGPLTLQPQVNSSANPYVFYIVGGTDAQARVLVDFATTESADAKTGVLIVSQENILAESVRKAIIDECAKKACGDVESVTYKNQAFNAVTLTSDLRKANKNAVFFMGAGDQTLAFMREADKLGWHPLVLVPGSLGNEVFDAPLAFKGRIFFSLPLSPSDQTTSGLNEYGTIAARYKLPQNHIATQLMVFSGAKILVEGLKRTGKDVTVDNLVESLETLSGFSTGLTPPVSYGPNRRVGANGGYVVGLDLENRKFVPVGTWRDID